jgi:hypothetical protein
VAQRLTEKNTHQLDSLGIFKQCLRLNNFNVIEYNLLWQQFVKSLLYRIHTLTFESHIKHMEYLNTQPVERVNAELTAKFLAFIRSENSVVYNNTYVRLCYQLVLSNFRFKKMSKLKKVLLITDAKFIKATWIALMLLLEEHFSLAEIK